MTTPDLSALRTIPAFAHLDETMLARLAGTTTLRQVGADEILFRRGDQAECLHILLEGRVALLGGDDDRGGGTVIEVVEPVDYFVLGTVFLGVPYLQTAQTLLPSRLLCLPADALRGAIAGEPSLAVAMLASLSCRYRALVRQLVHLKVRSTAERLGCYLLALETQQGGTGEVRLPHGKRMLAALLGTTPEHLSRAFATLRTLGVSTSGTLVTLADRDGLAAYAKPECIDDQEVLEALAAGLMPWEDEPGEAGPDAGPPDAGAPGGGGKGLLLAG